MIFRNDDVASASSTRQQGFIAAEAEVVAESIEAACARSILHNPEAVFSWPAEGLEEPPPTGNLTQSTKEGNPHCSWHKGLGERKKFSVDENYYATSPVLVAAKSEDCRGKVPVPKPSDFCTSPRAGKGEEE